MTDDVLRTSPRAAGTLLWWGDGVRALRIWIRILGMDRAPAGSIGEVMVRGLVRAAVAVALAPALALVELLSQCAHGWMRRAGVVWW